MVLDIGVVRDGGWGRTPPDEPRIYNINTPTY